MAAAAIQHISRSRGRRWVTVDRKFVRLSDTGSAVAGGVVAKTVAGEIVAARRLVLAMQGNRGGAKVGHVGEQGQHVIEVVLQWQGVVVES